ncbi:MAG: tripartite tricarboxylate transporter substrate binding protein [Thermodesulfobacteriota bacterium]
MKTSVAVVSLCLLFSGFWVSEGLCQTTFPTKPINLYLPFPPGGFIDLASRPLANAASKILGQPVVCINKPGASATLAPASLKAMNPDGYNLSVNLITLFYLPAQEDVPFDPMKDFTYITRTIGTTFGLVVKAHSPWKTYEELVAYSKANPHKVKYSTAAPKGTLRIAMEEIALKEGLKWDVVPFPGGVQAVTALLGGHVQACVQGPEWIPHVESGELRLLLTFGEERPRAFNKVPCMKELGYTGHPSPLGIVGPAGIPKVVVDKLDNAFKVSLKDPEAQKAFDSLHAPVMYMNSADYTAWARKTYEFYTDLVKKTGLGKK